VRDAGFEACACDQGEVDAQLASETPDGWACVRAAETRLVDRGQVCATTWYVRKGRRVRAVAG
jgi:hypothetical protein